MFLSFNHRSSQSQLAKGSDQDRNVARVVKRCLKVQDHCAAFLQHRTERLSIRMKKVLLAIFFLVSCGSNIYFIVKSFSNRKDIFISIAPIKVPVHIGQSGDKSYHTITQVTKEKYQGVQCIHRYMDSLMQAPNGKEVYNSILVSSPGLMDSMPLIGYMYRLQSSKKY